MTYIKQFKLTPPPRVSGSNPFTVLNIREAASATGPYSVIDSQSWDDSTPETVTATDVETVTATLENGWYEFQWEDASGAVTQWWGPVSATPGASGVVPSADEVALLLRTRTVGDLAVGLGADTGPADFTGFTSETRPSVEEVERVIATAVGAIEAQLLGEVSDDRQGQVRHAVALYAAVLIESSFFREQADATAIELWRNLIADLVRGLNAAIVDANPVLGSKGFGSVLVGGSREQVSGITYDSGF